MDIKTLKTGGVAVRSDFGLYRLYGEAGEIALLSIYGAPQQVEAVFAAVAGFRRAVLLPDGVSLQRSDVSLRARGRSIGYGKRHMLIWTPEVMGRSVIWMGGGREKKEAFTAFLSRRKVPCEEEFLRSFEKRLVEEDMTREMRGWGGLCGIKVLEDDDDRLCDVMTEIVVSAVESRHDDALRSVAGNTMDERMECAL